MIAYMSTVTSLAFRPSNNREIVAADVRAELASRKIKVAHLPGLLGNSREYWRRRITDATTALDIDDLTSLSSLLDVPVSHLVRNTKKTPGLTPGGQELPLMDSNHQPAGIKLASVHRLSDRLERLRPGEIYRPSETLAHVTQMSIVR